MAWTEQREGRYRGLYRDNNAKKHIAGYAPTAKKALQLATDQEAKIREGRWTNPTAGKITLDDYFNHDWLPKRHIEINTRAYYQSMYTAGLKEAFGHRALKSIKRSDVQLWVDQMDDDEVSPITIQKRYRTLKTILSAKRGASAMGDDLIGKDPCQNIELPKVIAREVTIYSPGEMEDLFAALDPWWLPVVVVAVDLGLRWGEMNGLEVGDFTPGFRSVHIRRSIIEVSKKYNVGSDSRYASKPPKNDKERFIALDPELSEFVATLVADRQLGADDRLLSMPDTTPPEDWHPPLSLIWTAARTDAWPQGLPISRAYFRTAIWLKAITEAKVPVRRFHDLRASHVSWLLAGGADLATVMARVGHTQITTTQKYAAAMQDADRRALDALQITKARYGKRSA